MTKSFTLSNRENNFFRLVQEAIFCNPFSRQRLDLDARISGQKEQPATDTVNKAIEAVAQQVNNLISKGKGNLRQYGSETDRQLVLSGFLFDLFYRHLDAFDELITRQMESKEKPCPVSFAPRVLDEMKERGFTPKEALHYFAFMYQLRRAFFFIFKGLVGQSPSMENLRCRLWNNIFTFDSKLYETFLWDRMEDFSTILLGETGTGKGTAAAALGRSGYIPFNEKTGCFAESFAGSFIAINLSQYPETLIESELFGHRKGAFTGAAADHRGVFSRCPKYGSIFLDEIGEVSVPIQIKLLQVLQERTFTMVGDHKQIRFEGRVIAATNRSLEDLRTQGKFRDDFYYRLCSDIITVPSLRDQIKENPSCFDEILGHTIDQIMGKPSSEFHPTLKGILLSDLGYDYPWPGNVRELEQAIRRVLITRQYQPVREGDSPGVGMNILHQIQEGTMNAVNLLEAYCTMLYEKHGTYEKVARITGLDRRTAKKNIRLP
jgi:DNA-binding NtrC family response regulator